MRRFSAFIVILLLLLTAAPLMACVTGNAMSQPESACCRTMHGNCGDMEKMGCCQKQFTTDTSPQLTTATPSTEPNIQWSVITYAPGTSHLVALVLRAQYQLPAEHSPPGLRIVETTNLRI
jgi:hypothetical protein